MFLSPIFGGCKYTNYFLFINKNVEFQYFGLLITLSRHNIFRQKSTEGQNEQNAFATFRKFLYIWELEVYGGVLDHFTKVPDYEYRTKMGCRPH